MNKGLLPNKIYFENLDGLRFFAFLLVFISHAALFLGYQNASPIFLFVKRNILVNGDVGVSFFFVLSGFLITYLLLKEKETRGTISLKEFYLRRIRRIWPVYFITLLVGFFILPIIMHKLIGNETLPFLVNPSLEVLPRYLFFLANFSLAFQGGMSAPTDILWSISVEEQFYLIWPLVIILLPKKHLLKAILVIIVSAFIYRYLNAYHENIVAYSTFSVMSDLAIGSLLAWLVLEKKHLIERFRHIPRYVIFFIYIITPLLIISRHWIFTISLPYVKIFSFLSATIPFALTILFAFIIFEQNEAMKSIFKTGKSKMFSFLGRISYGFYSYHMIVIALVLSLAWRVGAKLDYFSFIQWCIFIIASFFSTFFIAFISYRYLEKPILKK